MAYILSVRSSQWLAHFIVCVCVCVWSSCKYGHSTPVRRSEHILFVSLCAGVYTVAKRHEHLPCVSFVVICLYMSVFDLCIGVCM